MKLILKFMFEHATDPLGLPVEWYYEYALLAIIGIIACSIAYEKVGDMYHEGWISGGTAGSVFHWIIRLVVFIVMWAITYGVIRVYFFITAHWKIIVMTIFSALIIACLYALFVFIIRIHAKKVDEQK